MKKDVFNDQSLRTSLFNMIILKENIAEMIWYILTGLLVCSISYNSLIGAKCDNPIDLNEKQRDANKVFDKMDSKINKTKVNLNLDD